MSSNGHTTTCDGGGMATVVASQCAPSLEIQCNIVFSRPRNGLEQRVLRTFATRATTCGGWEERGLGRPPSMRPVAGYRSIRLVFVLEVFRSTIRENEDVAITATDGRRKGGGNVDSTGKLAFSQDPMHGLGCAPRHPEFCRDRLPKVLLESDDQQNTTMRNGSTSRKRERGASSSPRPTRPSSPGNSDSAADIRSQCGREVGG